MRPFSALLTVIILTTSTPAFAQTDGGPALGEYYCDYGGSKSQVYGPGRTFFLQEGDRYHADDGEEGTWSFDETTQLITFAGGFFDTIDAVGEFIGGAYSQIDIAPEGGVYTFCALQG